ncbi:sulfatase-like hydrolase/transferase, partial [Candidatus Latescibacterota bacterium]
MSKNSVTRRNFLDQTGKAVLGGTASLALSRLGFNTSASAAEKRPNVVLIMTDDQGYGDLGCHGNDRIKTPVLDRFASESIEFTQFYVCVNCAPTRSSLMTGRYNYRTGVTCVSQARSFMN